MKLPIWIIDPNSNRINFHEPFEVHYWMEQWNITEQDLRDAKLSIGSSIVLEVYKQLKLSGLVKGEEPAMSSFNEASLKVQSI